MNKKQNQLIDTYFRKRNVAIERGGRRNFYGLHEALYLYDKGRYDAINNLGPNDVVRLYEVRPELIDKINIKNSSVYTRLFSAYPELVDVVPHENISDYSIAHIILNQPQLIDKLPLDKLKSNGVFEILSSYPQFINKIGINKLSYDELTRLIIEQPSIIDYPELKKDRFDKYQIRSILMKHPHLADRLQINIMGSKTDFVYDLVMAQPKLKPYFKERGLI